MKEEHKVQSRSVLAAVCTSVSVHACVWSPLRGPSKQNPLCKCAVLVNTSISSVGASFAVEYTNNDVRQ